MHRVLSRVLLLLAVLSVAATTAPAAPVAHAETGAATVTATSDARDCAAAPTVDPTDGTVVDAIDYKLTYGCYGAGTLDLHVTLAAVTEPAEIELIAVYLDTDGNPSNGCNGADHLAVGGHDAGAFSAEVYRLTGCAETAWTKTADAFVSYAADTRALQLVLKHADIGSPGAFAWIGALSGASEETVEYLPKDGAGTVTGLVGAPARSQARVSTSRTSAGTAVVVSSLITDAADRPLPRQAAVLFANSDETGNAWRQVASGTTGSDGVVRFTTKPTSTTKYGVNAGPARSAPVAVTVSHLLKITAPGNGASVTSPVTFRGWVFPARAGVVIRVQYADGKGGYPQLAAVRTTGDGRYAVAVKPPAGRRPFYVIAEAARGTARSQAPVTLSVAAPRPAAQPAPRPAPQPAPQPAPTGSGGGGTYYSSCADARAAGATPLYRGQPGYRSGLDRDGDGVACEG